ncbi:MAG: ATP-binding protein [Pseudomonadota bacterium]
MKSLSNIVTHGTVGAGLKLRARAYGGGGIEDLLRDVLAMANASVDGHRYLVNGVDEDATGRRQLRDVPEADFTRSPSYLTLVAEYIEPAVRIKYYPVDVHGKRIGVFEIGDCADKPYMMRSDYSKTLRRGDAYARVGSSSVKLGRNQLKRMFEAQFRDALSSDQVEVGFAGDHITKFRSLQTFDIASLPSAVASGKLQEFLDVRDQARSRGETSMVARLTHARLYGSDSPYEYRSPDELQAELSRIQDEYVDHDERFLFEEHGERLQMAIYNQSEEALRNASLTVVMPAHEEFLVAQSLPKHSRGSGFVARSEKEQAAYPTVAVHEGAIQITAMLGDVAPGDMVDGFNQPLRVFAGIGLRGRRIGLQYVLSASNLRKPAKGKLRLVL